MAKRRLVSAGRERVDVADAGKAGEIVVGGADGGTALQGQRGDVGVRGEIAGRARHLQQAMESARASALSRSTPGNTPPSEAGFTL